MATRLQQNLAQLNHIPSVPLGESVEHRHSSYHGDSTTSAADRSTSSGKKARHSLKLLMRLLKHAKPSSRAAGHHSASLGAASGYEPDAPSFIFSRKAGASAQWPAAAGTSAQPHGHDDGFEWWEPAPGSTCNGARSTTPITAVTGPVAEARKNSLDSNSVGSSGSSYSHGNFGRYSSRSSHTQPLTEAVLKSFDIDREAAILGKANDDPASKRLCVR